MEWWRSPVRLRSKQNPRNTRGTDALRGERREERWGYAAAGEEAGLRRENVDVRLPLPLPLRLPPFPIVCVCAVVEQLARS